MHIRQIHFSSTLSYFLVVSLIVLFCFYVLWQARFLITGPEVTLSTELNPIQNNRVITLTGETKNITRITVNDRPIITNEFGEFSESIILENGYTIVSIKAQDRYGRETAIERPFVYVPKTLLQ